jgi:hypothetical protein
MRLLNAGIYKTAIIIGCDIQTPFIVSGFQSFKALSQEQCRPFDSNRTGLNLGEAAATIIWTTAQEGKWKLLAGSNHNDANHISGPSRTGEGLYRTLMDLKADMRQTQLAMISVHGTATLYNDEMESIAIHRADLEKVPVCALKGYYGHTMGTAGILETIIGMICVEKNIIPAIRGFKQLGTSNPLNIPAEKKHIQGKQFTKKEFERINGDLDRPIGEYNCRHFVFSIIMGVNTPAFSKNRLTRFKNESLSKVSNGGKEYTKYEATQVQRQLETAIRKQKDRQIIARASNDKEEIGLAQAKITQLTTEYNKFSKTAGLDTYKNRLSVSGYHRVRTK